MARHRKIDVRMWGDERFVALSSPKPNAQTLWVFLLTGPQTTAAPGLFSAGEAALAEMLDWPLPAFRKCFREIEVREMAKADWRARVVWIPKAVLYNPAENPNTVKAWRRAIAEIPECALRDEAAAVLRAASGFPEVFELGMEEDERGRLRFGSGKDPKDPSGSPSGNPSGSQSGSASGSGSGTSSGSGSDDGAGSDSTNGSRKRSRNQEQEQEQDKKDTPPTPRKRGGRAGGLDPGFEAFWAAYPKHVGRADAEKAWAKLTRAERERALELAPVYAEAMADRPEFVKNPSGWLNGKRFADDPVGWRRGGAPRALVGAHEPEPGPRPSPATPEVVLDPPPPGGGVWPVVLEALRPLVDERDFDTWFRPTRQVGEPNGTLRVAVAPLFRRYVPAEYGGAIESACRACGVEVPVEFLTTEAGGGA